jgi:hypothetical protein
LEVHFQKQTGINYFLLASFKLVEFAILLRFFFCHVF